MRPDKILQYCLNNLEGTVLVNSWGEKGIFYNPNNTLKRGVYILTVKEKDGENDKSSNLDRENIYRVNMGLRKNTFVNMFGGDYFDWTKEENKEAIQFLHDLVANKETPVDQIADKYDQMNPKINDGKYGCWFMWGLGTDYAKADMLGADKIHMAMVPDFSGNGERAIFTDSWNYVLNSASKNKDAAIKFLQYMADEGGMEASYKAFDRYPARKDVAEKVVPDTDPAKEMYSQYAEECNVQGRPLVAQTMEFISDMGTIFQSCMKDEITVDEFCKKAQEVVDTYQ